MSAYLDGVKGEYSGKRIHLGYSQTMLGRGSASQIRFQAANISREHAVVYYTNGVYAVQDCNSRLGTFVNGKAVTSAQLRSGDVITIGTNKFRFIQLEQPSPDASQRQVQPVQKNNNIGMIFLVAVIVLAAVWGISTLMNKSGQGQVIESNASEEDEWGIVIQEPTATVDPSYGAIAEAPQEFLPTYPVPAGQPIYYDGWSMMVSNEIDSGGKKWGITVVIQNLEDNQRIFRFVNAGVTAHDNLGNSFPPANLEILTDCEAYYHTVKNLEVQSGEMVWIRGYVGGYDQCDMNKGLHAFLGPIPIEVDQMIIHFDDFGPFSGIDVVIEL